MILYQILPDIVISRGISGRKGGRMGVRMPNNLDLEVKELQVQNQKLIRATDEILKLLLTKSEETKMDPKEFYTLEETWQMKGGCSLNTLKANPFLRVGCGNPKYARYIGGRLCFSRSDTLEWANICDGPEYIEYAKKCGITVIPEKYLRLAKKASKVEEIAK